MKEPEFLQELHRIRMAMVKMKPSEKEKLLKDVREKYKDLIVTK